MLNHARALRERGWRVGLAGYGDSPLPSDLADDEEIQVQIMDAGSWGKCGVVWMLVKEIRRRKWTAVLVQNPPGFPVLLVLWLMARRDTRRVLDWHNFGSSLLKLRQTPRRHAALFYDWCEQCLAGFAHDHWAVSRALAEALPEKGAVVVRDHPSHVFGQAASRRREFPGEPDRLAWWRRTLPEVPPPAADRWVVAPSSWGPDEDTDAILRVAAQLNRADQWEGTASLVVIATGRGPAQPEFGRRALKIPAGPVRVCTVWLPPTEYAVLLGYADAGLCLHRSSSGLDLPMKLADFRGAGCKALVFDYGPVLDEVFQPDADGWKFSDDEGLAAGLQRIAGMGESPRLPSRKEDRTWESEWNHQLGEWAEAREEEARRR